MISALLLGGMLSAGGLAPSTASAIVWSPIGPPGAQVTAIGGGGTPVASLFAGTLSDGVWESGVGGGTWVRANAGLTNLHVTALAPGPTPNCPAPCLLPPVPPAVYAGTDNGVFFRIDGAAWTDVSGDLPDRRITAVALAVDFVLVGTPSGVFRSPQGETKWTKGRGLLDGVRSLAFVWPSTVYAGANGGIFRSTDKGATWTALQANSFFVLTDVDSIATDPRIPSVVYASGLAGCRPPCAAPVFPAIERSEDSGNGWTITAQTGFFTKTSLAVTSDSTVYAGSLLGVIRSTNGGGSWSAAADGLTNPAVLSLATDGLRVYAGTDGGGIFATEAFSTCLGQSDALCLGVGGRFRVTVSWSASNIGQSGTGQAIPLTSDTGGFWFFQPSNIELVVKVLDGRALNGHFWVFWGALTNVGYAITVTDTLTGASKTYSNAEGTLASNADTEAF